MTGVAVIYAWQTPTLTQRGMLIGTGVIAGCVQSALFESMRQAPVSVLAPFYLSRHSEHDVVVGAIMILGAGLIIVSERLHHRATA
ncbi:hypothetical protein FHX08_005010 [Rhizobium sp. BK529]|nr:hypothetical protein [Rhizobium sp. BK529]TCS02347.1 hypothetical protein EV281_105304 [Rhizobium sp. BK418]